MKTAKKILAYFLALATLFSLCVPAFAIDAPQQDDEKFNYVSLGASMTNGYGLRCYLDEGFYKHPWDDGFIDPGLLSLEGPGASGWRREVDEAYPALIRDVLSDRYEGVKEVKLHQLAQSSMRVEELRFLIDESFTSDKYTKWRFYDGDEPGTKWWDEDLEAFRKDYQDSIAYADLITYDLGANNFGVYLSNRLVSQMFTADLHDVYPEEEAAKYYELRDKVLEAIGLFFDVDIPAETANFYIDTLAYALLGFQVNFDATMKRIRELNPDCDIVVLGIQNVMAGVEMSVGDTVIPFGDLMQVVIDMANMYMQAGSPFNDTYFYADLGRGHVTFFYNELMQYNGKPSTLSDAMKDCFNVYQRGLNAEKRIFEFLDSQLGAYLDSEPGQAILNYVLNSVYDALARILQTAGSFNPMPLDGILNGENMKEVNDALMGDIMTVFQQVTVSAIQEVSDLGPEALLDLKECSESVDLDAAIENMFSTDIRKLAGAFGMRTSIGNTFFSHPSPAGYQQIADVVLNAWDNNISGSSVFAEEMKEIETQLFDLVVEYGSEVGVFLLDELADSFPVSDSDRELMKSFIPSAPTAEKVVRCILDVYDIHTFTDAANFRFGLDKVQKILDEDPLVLRQYRSEVIEIAINTGVADTLASSLQEALLNGLDILNDLAQNILDILIALLDLL